MKDFFRKNYILLIITVLSAVGFCVLSYLTVLQFSVQSVEQLIETSNSGIIKEVETSLSYGKKLSNYYGISQVLSKAQELLPEESILTITDADGGVIATTEGTEHFTVSLSEYGVVEQTICEETGEKAGVLTTYYRKQPVRAQLKPVVLSSVVGSIIILLAVVLITAFIHTKRPLSGGGVAAVFTAAILLQGALLTVTYGGAFEDVARKSVTSVADYVTSSVNHVLDKGVHISEIADLDSFFAEVVRDNNVIEDIRLTGKGSVSEDEYTIVDEITDLSARKVIVYYISEENIRSLVIQMVLTFVATSFLSVIVMRESLTLSEMLSFRRSEDFNTQTDEQFDVIAKAIRYGNFLSLTFDYLCLSFSALLIKEWNEGFLFMSPVMAAALSISICQIADLLGMIAMPSIGRHIKGQYLMAVSALLVIFSNAACFLTHSVGIIILMRFFAGLGTAGTKQVRNMVIAKGYANEVQRNTNLAASNNGVIGGMLCGLGLGGVVAGSFGYQSTFLVAGVGFVLYMVFEAWCIPWALLAERSAGTMAEEEEGNLLVRILTIFRSAAVWRTIAFIVVPQYFLLMIIVTLVPGRIQSLGLPGVVLTYANLLNGVIGLYVGERLYRLLQRVIKNDLRIEIIMLVTGAVTLFVMDIPLFQTLIILLVASLAGILDGVGTPVSTDIFMGNAFMMMHLNDTEILMLYSMIGSAVMAVAPFLLELCEKSVPWMFGTGIVLVACALLLLPDVGKRGKKGE